MPVKFEIHSGRPFDDSYRENVLEKAKECNASSDVTIHVFDLDKPENGWLDFCAVSELEIECLFVTERSQNCGDISPITGEPLFAVIKHAYLDDMVICRGLNQIPEKTCELLKKQRESVIRDRAKTRKEAARKEAAQKNATQVTLGGFKQSQP